MRSRGAPRERGRRAGGRDPDLLALPGLTARQEPALGCESPALARLPCPRSRSRPRRARSPVRRELFSAERLQLRNPPARDETTPALGSLGDAVLRLCPRHVPGRGDKAAERLPSHAAGHERPVLAAPGAGSFSMGAQGGFFSFQEIKKLLNLRDLPSCCRTAAVHVPSSGGSPSKPTQLAGAAGRRVSVPPAPGQAAESRRATSPIQSPALYPHR